MPVIELRERLYNQFQPNKDNFFTMSRNSSLHVVDLSRTFIRNGELSVQVVDRSEDRPIIHRLTAKELVLLCA